MTKPSKSVVARIVGIAMALLGWVYPLFRRVMEVISVGGIPDDMATWSKWLDLTSMQSLSLTNWALLVVGLGIVLYTYDFHKWVWRHVTGKPASNIEREQEPEPSPSLAAKAFEQSPFLGKRAAKYIIEQTSAEDGENILWAFRRHPEPQDRIFAEAAWCELLAKLGHKRLEKADFNFGCTYAEHPNRNEAEEYAKRLSGRALIENQEAVKANPGNGWRVHRLMMSSAAVDRVEALYQDFMSQPHKMREPLVFVTYWLKKSHLAGVSPQHCWMQMARAAVAHERETGNHDFWAKGIEEAAKVQQELWPD